MLSVSLGDMLKVLDQFKEWKRMVAAPARIDALEAQVAALEARLTALAATPPGEVCPYCRRQSLRLLTEKPHPTFGRLGAKIQVFKCGEPECGKTIERDLDK